MTSTALVRGQLVAGDATVSTLRLRPEGARALLVFAHGAGAGMAHPLVAEFAEALAEVGIATFRYQFPYMERRGAGPPDRTPRLLETVAAAAERAVKLAQGLPLLAGGRSMGARITALAAGEGRLPAEVLGLVHHAFPFHRPGKPSAERSERLLDVTLPMLFLGGSRDRMAAAPVVESARSALGSGARMHIVPDADHQFRLTRRAARDASELPAELAQVTRSFVDELLADDGGRA